MVAAVAKGGVITFSCGAAPVVIAMPATAKVVNISARVVLDGGGKVTLSGGGQRRILYMNTCDQAQTWTTSHYQNQSQPQLTVQNITFADGNSTGQQSFGGGGGAVFASGGRLAIVNARFIGNRCDSTGPDLGGSSAVPSAAVRAKAGCPRRSRHPRRRQRGAIYTDGDTYKFSDGYPGIFFLGAGRPAVSGSTLK